MLADPGLDSVYIATPNSVHAAQAIRAAEAGKNVLCEKPMALNVEDCERMIESAARNKVKLGVVFQNRYHPAHVEARSYVASGKLGSIDLAYGSQSKLTCKGTIGEPQPDRAQQLTIESDTSSTEMTFLTDISVPDKLTRLVEDFNKSVRDNTPLGISGENGMQMVRIAVAMAESAKKGKAVRID